MPDNEGSTSLHLACLSGNNRVVKKLLLKGAKKKIPDNKGLIPSDIAR